MAIALSVVGLAAFNRRSSRSAEVDVAQACCDQCRARTSRLQRRLRCLSGTARTMPRRRWGSEAPPQIGLAIADGILTSLDQTLAELLPQHRHAMSTAVADVTPRQLMSMSAGFVADPPAAAARKIYATGENLVDYLLR